MLRKANATTPSSAGAPSDSESASAASSARRCGRGSSGNTSGTTPPIRSASPTNENAASASAGRQESTRYPRACAASTAASHSAVFPIPASPVTTATAGSPSRASRRARSEASSSSLPTSSETRTAKPPPAGDCTTFVRRSYRIPRWRRRAEQRRRRWFHHWLRCLTRRPTRRFVKWIGRRSRRPGYGRESDAQEVDALVHRGGDRRLLVRCVQCRWHGERRCAQKSGSAEVKRGGTLRLNVSNTDFEFTDPAVTYDSLGWSMLFATGMALLSYPDKPGLEGSRLVPEAATGLPAGLERRQDVHVHGPQGDPVQRWVHCDRRGVQACVRACRRPEAGLAGDRVHAHRRRARMLATRARPGSISGVTAKGQTFDRTPEASRPDVSRPGRDAVLRCGEAEHADRREGHQRLSRRPARTHR